ncbi:hypothetical protein Trydic_g21842, partial [Trypoxylus dichotomus]
MKGIFYFGAIILVLAGRIRADLIDCPPNGQSFHPLPNSCEQFIACIQGEQQLVSCAPGFYFDPERGHCYFADEVECVINGEPEEEVGSGDSEEEIVGGEPGEEEEVESEEPDEEEVEDSTPEEEEVDGSGEEEDTLPDEGEPEEEETSEPNEVSTATTEDVPDEQEVSTET